MASRDKSRPPIHPGEILREEVLPGLGMSATDAAAEMHVTRQALHRVLAGRAAVSPEMALRIGKFCGNGGDIWLRMQTAYDLWHADRKLAGEIAAIKTQRVWTA
jgi:addiction module HigA family antidote